MYKFVLKKDVAFRIRYLGETKPDEIIIIHYDRDGIQELAAYLAKKIQSGERITCFNPEDGLPVAASYDDLEVRKELNQKILAITGTQN